MILKFTEYIIESFYIKYEKIYEDESEDAFLKNSKSVMIWLNVKPVMLLRKVHKLVKKYTKIKKDSLDLEEDDTVQKAEYRLELAKLKKEEAGLIEKIQKEKEIARRIAENGMEAGKDKDLTDSDRAKAYKNIEEYKKLQADIEKERESLR